MPISGSLQRFRGYAAALFFALAVAAWAPGVALAQEGYVTLRGAGQALVFDPTDPGALTNTVVLGSSPSDIAVSPDGSVAYAVVANAFVYRLVDGVRDAAPLTQQLNGVPERIVVSPDGGKLFVANAIVRRVQVVDVATGVRTNLDFPGGGTLWGIDAITTPAGDRVYVAAPTTDQVLVLDAATNALIATVPVGSVPQGVAASPLGDRVYVANYNGGSVSVIDTSSNSVSTIEGIGGGPMELAVNADGSRVYVTLRTDGDVAVIDTGSNTVLEALDLGSDADSLHDIAFSDDGIHLVVAHFGSHRVSVIDTTNGNAVVTTARMGSTRPRYVAFRPLVAVRPDLPPVFNLPLCGATFEASLGTEVAIPLSATDDHGIRVTAVESPAGGGGRFLPALPTTPATLVESTWRWTPSVGDPSEVRTIALTASDGVNPAVSCNVNVHVLAPPEPPPAGDDTEFPVFRLSFAKVGTRGRLADTFWFNGDFAVDLASGDGIDPAAEEVTIKIEGTAWTLPPGAFHSRLGGRVFTYRGDIGATRLHVLITRRGRPNSRRYHIQVVGWRGTFDTVDNPLEMCVSIGDDFGCAHKRGRIY